MGKRVKSIWQASSSSSQYRLRVEATKKKTKNVIRLMSFGGTFYTHREAEKKKGEKWKKCIFQNSCTTAQNFLPIFPRQENKVRKE